MIDKLALNFHDSELPRRISSLSESELDELGFGVIGFDDETVVRWYNSFEAKCAGLSKKGCWGNRFLPMSPRV